MEKQSRYAQPSYLTRWREGERLTPAQKMHLLTNLVLDRPTEMARNNGQVMGMYQEIAGDSRSPAHLARAVTLPTGFMRSFSVAAFCASLGSVYQNTDLRVAGEEHIRGILARLEPSEAVQAISRAAPLLARNRAAARLAFQAASTALQEVRTPQRRREITRTITALGFNPNQCVRAGTV